jgi:hypothetical protein
MLAPVLFLVRGAGWVPYVGRPLSEAGTLLEVAHALADGGARITRGADPLLAEVDAPASQDGGEALPPAARLQRALQTGAADLQAGDVLLNHAARLRRDLHPDDYRGPFSALRSRVATLDADLPRATRTADALALLPGAVESLFGFSGRRTYVVLGQDSAEQRPTGGFIGSAGLISFDQGKLSFQEYRSSYDFDGVDAPPLVAPPAIQAYLHGCCLYLRDANMSPDFPTTARTVLDFVARDLGVHADGVISFDNDAVTYLLKALGPLQVAGYPTPVTAENWFDLSTQTLYTGPDALAKAQGLGEQQAKTVGLGALLQAVIGRVQTVRGGELNAVVDQLRAAAGGNHLLVDVLDQQPAVWARLVGADGSILPQPDGDVVFPVDTNFSFSKVGPYIQRDYGYEVWLDAGGRPQRATATLRYHNRVDSAALNDPNKRIAGQRWDASLGGWVNDPGFFGDYLRLYVPQGSVPTTISGLSGPAGGGEDGYTSLSGFLSLEAQAQATVSFDYEPAYAATQPGTYRLTLFKEGGIDKIPWHVVVHLAPGTRARTIPPGATMSGDTVSLDLEVTGTTRLDFSVTHS